jgi:uncharacterized membrane protein YhaH (DUF805 family)
MRSFFTYNVTYKGRCCRKHYVLCTLGIIVGTLMVLLVARSVFLDWPTQRIQEELARGRRASVDPSRIQLNYEHAADLIGWCCVLLLSFPAVKRLHDLGRSGWEYFLFLLPFYNIYLGLLLLFKRGSDGDNKYGPDPLAAS